MKKILGLALSAFVLMALVAGGTWAYFSDTETSGTNTITAGKVNLRVNNDVAFSITQSGRRPGQNGHAITDPYYWLVNNDGDINGDLKVTLSAITNDENTRYNMETAAGDVSDIGGELGSLFKMAFWMDVDKESTWSDGDYYLNSAGAKVVWVSGSTLPAAAYDVLDNYDSDVFVDCQTGVAGGADFGYFWIEYDFPEGGSTDNKAQTDSCEFTITFDLEPS